MRPRALPCSFLGALNIYIYRSCAVSHDTLLQRGQTLQRKARIHDTLLPRFCAQLHGASTRRLGQRASVWHAQLCPGCCWSDPLLPPHRARPSVSRKSGKESSSTNRFTSTILDSTAPLKQDQTATTECDTLHVCMSFLPTW